MVDREKVMKGLRCLSNPYIQDMDERDCENCQYDNASCFLDVTADALSMLKAQEPFEPVELINDFYPIGDPLRTIGWRCGKCGEMIAGHENYCPNCGKAVKWE